MVSLWVRRILRPNHRIIRKIFETLELGGTSQNPIAKLKEIISFNLGKKDKPSKTNHANPKKSSLNSKRNQIQGKWMPYKI